MTWDDIKQKVASTAPALAAMLDGPVASFAETALAQTLAIQGDVTPDSVEAALSASGDGSADKLRSAETQAVQLISTEFGQNALALKKLDLAQNELSQKLLDIENARTHELTAKDW